MRIVVPIAALLAACEPAPPPVVATPAVALEAPEVEPVRAAGLLGVEGVPHHDEKFHDHLEEAMLLRDRGDEGLALDALRLAVWDAPDSGSAWFELGRSFIALGSRERGLSCVEEALRREPLHADALRLAIRDRLDRGDGKGARPLADRLAKAARDDVRTPHLRSRVFLALSMWTEAIAEGRRAIALEPTFVYAYNSVGYAALQLGRNELALQYLEAGSELDGFEPHMRNNLGVAYEKAGRFGDALAAFGQAAMDDPSHRTAAGNRDRVQKIVDEQISDAVSQMLADRARKQDPPASASAEP